MLAEYIRRENDCSHDADKRLHEKTSAARKAQRVHMAVAPGIWLTVIREGKAKVLAEGEEVLPSDLIDGSPSHAVRQRLDDVGACIVLDSDELARLRTAPTARFVVADGGSILTKAGHIPPGCEVRAEDCAGGQADIDYFVNKGAVIDRQPPPQAA